MTDLLEEDSGPSCPCCGGHTYSDTDCEYGEPCGWSVTCMKCQLTIYKKTKELALAAWTRTPTTDTSEKAAGGDVPEIDDMTFEQLRQSFTTNFFHNGPNMNAPEMSIMLVQIREENVRLKREAATTDARIAELEAALVGMAESVNLSASAYEATLADVRNDALEEAASWHDARQATLQQIIDRDETPITGDELRSRLAGHSADADAIRALKTDTQGVV